MKKNLTEIYLEAARMIEEREQQFSCVAIQSAARESGSVADSSYSRVYPEAKAYIEAFNLNFHRPLRIKNATPEELVTIRVLMLSLMAWAHKDL